MSFARRLVTPYGPRGPQCHTMTPTGQQGFPFDPFVLDSSNPRSIWVVYEAVSKLGAIPPHGLKPHFPNGTVDRP